MIQFNDIGWQYIQLQQDLDSGYKRVMDSGWYILGVEVDSFEKEFSQYLGVEHAISVASGTDALQLALTGLKIPQGSEVIVPANAYPTVWGLSAAGMIPVLVDIDPTTHEISLKDLQKKMTPDIRAAIVVHLYGNNMLTRDVLRVIKKSDVFLIEDCAQAFGAKKGDQYVGTCGDIGTFSFYPTKPLGGYGDGGMVITPDDTIANRIRSLRVYGENERYNSTLVGVNSRLDELQAALLRTKLPYVRKWSSQRLSFAKEYFEALRNVGDLQFYLGEESNTSVAHLCVVTTDKRDELKSYLEEKNIYTGIHYPVALSRVESIQSKILGGPCPQAEEIAEKTLSLPLHNGLTVQERELVISTIREFY